MSNWLQNYFKGIKKIENVGWDLDHLSDLFYEIGNDKIAERLHKLSINLLDGVNLVKESHNENFNEQVKRTQENSATIFKAVIAGIKLKEEENETD